MYRDFFDESNRMKFNSHKVAFGRHETFALRYSWLTKGFQALKNNSGVFEPNNATATIELGVGKNMVHSIRYWLRACQMMDPDTSELTDLGNLILGELDVYQEDEATIWLIHWLLATNPELATSWYWFFNKFHKPEFTSEELTTALYDFVKDKVKAKTRSLGTIKSDSQLLHRMYVQSKGSKRVPIEDALDSPLALLRLITQTEGGRGYQSRPEARSGLPTGIIGFAIVQLLEERKVKMLPIEELMYSRDDYPAPGSVFRLTENDLIAKLERLVLYIPDVFEIRETAGIHQLYMLKESSPEAFLKKHYADVLQGMAA